MAEPVNVVVRRGLHSGAKAHRGVGPRSAVKMPIAALGPGIRVRQGGEDPRHVRELASSGGEFAPLVVHRQTMIVIDGMHRLQAATLRGAQNVPVQFFDGSPDEAFVLAVKLNCKQGLPPSLADRRAAAERILNGYPQWSDQAIAEVAMVSDKTIAAMRRRSTSEFPSSTHRIGRDGRRRPVDAARGRLQASEMIMANPDISLREIARRAGLALGTARDVKERLLLGIDPLPPGLQVSRSDIGQPPRPIEPPSDTALSGVLEELSAYLRKLEQDNSLRTNDTCAAITRVIAAQHAGLPARLDLALVPRKALASVAEAARACSAVWDAVAVLCDDGS